jgi:hypothetical protein
MAQVDPTIKISVPPPVSTVQKCGVNTFLVSNECGVGVFKNVYFKCYDGYEANRGGDTSCKSSEAWQQYAREACAGHCRYGADTGTSASAGGTGTNAGMLETSVITPSVSVCSIDDSLMKNYDSLLAEIKAAEAGGDTVKVNEITQKIVDLRQQITRGEQACLGNASAVFQEPVPTVTINRCGEADQWKDKVAYYQKIDSLSDEALKQEYGFTREEIRNTLTELQTGLLKITVQCTNQNALTAAPAPDQANVQGILDSVKPVAAQSADEINAY